MLPRAAFCLIALLMMTTTASAQYPQTTTDILDRIDALEGDLATVVDYGDSGAMLSTITLDDGWVVPGSDLLAIEIGNRKMNHTKPVLMVVGGIHPREYSTVEMSLRFAEHLVNNYGISSDVTRVVDTVRTVVIPLSNPDGYDAVRRGFDQTGAPWMWRKTVTETGSCAFPPVGAFDDHHGVDMARSFPEGWGTGTGVSPAGNDDVCSWTHRGPASAAPPETAALMAYASSIMHDSSPGAGDATDVWITLHAPFGTVLYPWSWQSTAPADFLALDELADQMAVAGSLSGSGQGHSHLYPMDGAPEDWVYAELGAAAFLYEVDTDLDATAAQIDAEWPNVLTALMVAAGAAGDPMVSPSEPAISGLSIDEGGLVTGTVAPDAEVSVTVHHAPGTPLAVPLVVASSSGSFAVQVPSESLSGPYPVQVFARASLPGSTDYGVTSSTFMTAASPVPPPDVVTGLLEHFVGPVNFDGTTDVHDFGLVHTDLVPPMTMTAVLEPDTCDGTIWAWRDGGSFKTQFYTFSCNLCVKETDSGSWGGSNSSCGGSTTRVTTTGRHHVAVVLGSDGSVTFYLTDSAGNTVSESGNRSNGTFAPRSIRLSVGARWAGWPSIGWPFDGEIEHAKLYNRALSSSEVAYLALQDM